MANKISTFGKRIRFTLKLQFWLNVIGLISFIVALCFMLYFTNNKLKTYNALYSNFSKIAYHNALMRSEVRDSLPKGIINKKNESIEAINELLKDCSNYDKWNNISDYFLEIDTLKTHTAFYESLLASAYEVTNKRGNKNSKAIGEMNAAAETLIKLSNNVIADYDISAYLLELLQYEKNFLIDKNDESVANFNASIDRFKKLVEFKIKDESLKNEIIGKINVYNLKFNAVVRIEESIGLTNNTGLKHNLELAYNKLSDKTNTLVDLTGKKKERTLLLLDLEFLVAIIVIFITFIAFQTKLFNAIFKPLKLLRKYFESMSQGEIPEVITYAKGNNEFTDIIELLNNRINTLNETEQFARAIRDGNYDAEFKPVSNKDVLGISLLEMRENLKTNKEENEKRAKAEQQQTWISQGTAKIAQALNQNYQNANDFAYSIINTLVVYLEANQGGLFMINDDDQHDPFLELKGLVAYNRRKFADRKVKFGEGFVGTCVLEKKAIYRTEIPNDYIEITSGLGGANPNILLIVPLMVDEEIYGVIEIASFKKFEEYQIEFVKRISETIATTISSVKSKERTEKLLKMTQEQSEKIAQTEEEMRQNIEELKATHEEMERQQVELKENEEFLTSIIDLAPFAVFVKNENREYVIVNKEQCKLLDRASDSVIQRRDIDLLTNSEEIKIIQESDTRVIIGNEKVVLPRQQITLKDGSSKVYQTIKAPFTNNKTKATNIIGVSIDISESIDAEKALEEAQKTIEELKKKLES